MRIAAIAALAALTALPAAAQTFKLTRPADANKDGVVTREEQLDYDARQLEKRPPQEIPVAAPKSSGGDGVTFRLAEPESDLDKRAVKASSFEEAQDALARKAQAEKDD